jgi:CPA2 family monovalent cation:H+ antiporter-2
VIAGLAVVAGVDRSLAALATAYVLITMVAGPLLARIPDARRFKDAALRIQTNRNARHAS